MFLSRKEVMHARIKKALCLAVTALMFDAMLLLAFYLNGTLM